MDCIFCKIVKGEIPCTKVYEDEDVLAFDDINPIAPVHTLVIPKKHIENISSLTDKDNTIVAAVMSGVREVAQIKGITDKGYRVISNNGTGAGQEVFHMHFHVLGGKDNMGPMLA